MAKRGLDGNIPSEVGVLRIIKCWAVFCAVVSVFCEIVVILYFVRFGKGQNRNAEMARMLTLSAIGSFNKWRFCVM